jgi:hypothetical protein
MWGRVPHLRIFTDPVFPQNLKDRLHPAVRVRYPRNHSPTIPLAVFQDRLVSMAISLVSLPDDSSELPVAVRIDITDEPYFTLNRKRYRIAQVEITGLLARRHVTVPFTETLTMEDEAGQPFAGVAVAAVGDLLIAIATSSGGNTLNFMLLPPGLRQIRPLQHRLRGPNHDGG